MLISRSARQVLSALQAELLAEQRAHAADTVRAAQLDVASQGLRSEVGALRARTEELASSAEALLAERSSLRRQVRPTFGAAETQRGGHCSRLAGCRAAAYTGRCCARAYSQVTRQYAYWMEQLSTAGQTLPSRHRTCCRHMLLAQLELGAEAWSQVQHFQPFAHRELSRVLRSHGHTLG